jgi:O-acetyl-ADP-ribose deacetylase (regulator of RNase III)
MNMVEIVKGNLLQADADALVNTVNCVGFMGKGIALQFKQAYPDNFRVYRSACDRKEVTPGTMLVVPTGTCLGPRLIINFPTKRHYRQSSRLEDIRSGLLALVEEVTRRKIKSIAVPPLGCGNGGLDWEVVRPLIMRAFDELPAVRVLLYEPAGAPDPSKMVVGTTTPSWTRARALFVRLMEQYQLPDYRLSRLEVQKLAYFLQVAGEPLRLRFVAHQYGPYAENLNHVLQLMEGHFIRGYGDRSRESSIALVPGATDQAREFLNGDEDGARRLREVAELIEGFETPYGMELLATAHWVAAEEPTAPRDVEETIKGVQSWSQRKKARFRPEHIRRAYQRLEEQRWLTRPRAEAPRV